MQTSGGSSQTRSGSGSPVTAILYSLFGGDPRVSRGQYMPTSFGGPNAAFNTSSFGNITGLLQNQPLTSVEQGILGAQNGGFGGGVQGMAVQNALQSQDLLNQGAAAIPALLQTDPTAQIAQAKRQFQQETLPTILERSPGWSSSDLQRQLTQAGTDLGVNIAALKEQNLGRVGQVVSSLPGYAQAQGSNLLDQMSQVLGFGTLGRQFAMEQSPAGDAFRVLTALQSLTGPSMIGGGATSRQGSLGILG